jgi:hypothetical protein
MFNSDLETIKDYTILIQPESEGDETPIPENNESIERVLTEEELAPLSNDGDLKKDKKKEKDDKKGSKLKGAITKQDTSPVKDEVKEEEKDDLNAKKVIPQVIHLSRDVVKKAS